MIKHLLIISVCFLINIGLLNGQHLKGIHSSNYFPLQNLTNNVGDLVLDTNQIHINALSAHVYIQNQILQDESDIAQLVKKVGFSTMNSLMTSIESDTYMQGRISLPSISYRFNNKNTVAFSSSIRALGYFAASHKDVTQIFSEQDKNSRFEDLANEAINGVVLSWTEYSLSYSRLLIDNSEYAISGGLSLKLNRSGGNGYVNMDGINIEYDNGHIKRFDVNVDYAINNIIYDIGEDGKIKFNGDYGLGADIGFSFIKKNTTTKARYQYKIGFSINDIGGLQNKSKARQEKYQISVTDVPLERFNGITSIDQLVDSLDKSVDMHRINNKEYSLSIPTKLNIFGDYSINSKVYVNGSFSISKNPYKGLLNVKYSTLYEATLTPKHETNTWGFYLPVGYHNITGFTCGIAAKWKYIFIGTTRLITNLFNYDPNKMELYAGVNIPLNLVNKN